MCCGGFLLVGHVASGTLKVARGWAVGVSVGIAEAIGGGRLVGGVVNRIVLNVGRHDGRVRVKVRMRTKTRGGSRVDSDNEEEGTKFTSKRHERGTGGRNRVLLGGLGKLERLLCVLIQKNPPGAKQS